jgi:DHA1 family tetracycline resistance protein-like MFS transporter
VIAHARASFTFIFITALLDMVAFGVIIPVLPQLIVHLEGGDVPSAATIFGIFGTAFALMQFFFSPVLGALGDRFGRRPVVLLSNLGLAIDYVVMALAPNVGVLFLGRLIAGVTASSFSTASAYVADVTPPERRAARFGMLGVAFSIGFIVGPAIGGLLGNVDLRAPFWASAALSFANFLYGLLVLPESLPPGRRGAFHPKAANPVGAMRFLGSRPAIASLAIAAFFAYLAHDSLPHAFVLYSSYRFAFDERAIGLSLTLVGLSGLVVQGLVVGRAVAALGEHRTLLLGLVIGIAAQLLLGLGPVAPVFLLGIPVWPFFGLTGPSLQAIASREVDANEQGRLQGSLASLRSIATLISPLVFTQTFALAIGPLAGLGVPGAPFLLSAVLLAIATAILLPRQVARPATA